MPVQVLGLSDAPGAGDDLLVVESERKAREVALYRQGKYRDVRLAGATKKVEDVFSQLGENAGQYVNLIVKADVQGSAEALRDSLSKIGTDEVSVKVIASGVGGITESDVSLAAASRARIIGFNVRADGAARSALKDQGVEVNYYSIIYEALDDVRSWVSGMLKPEIKEQIVGLAEVREVFRSSKFGTVAGCLVTEGVIKRGNPVRVLRENVVIHQGELDSLRRFKDDVGEVRGRHRVRHRRGQVQRHPRRRPDRVLRPLRGRAQRVRQMPREVPRARRIAEQVQRVLSQLLLREVRDPRLKPMTITHVKVSPDLTHVWVHVHAAGR